MLDDVAFFLYSGLIFLVATFQFCLAIGLPWGTASMGGRFPGAYPKNMRILPVISIAILVLFALIGAIRMGFVFGYLFETSKILM